MASNLTVDTIRNSSGNAVLMENGARIYAPGQTVQQHYYRYDGIESFTTAASGLGATDHSEFGRLVHATPFDTAITPQFSNSLIVWELQIYGEPTSHNTGWLIGENVVSTATVIRRTGYEGYNNTRTRDQQNTFISDHYDGGDNNSTNRLTRIMYFDKPETTATKIYQMIFTSTDDNTNHTYRINRTANTAGGSVQADNYEIGVSTWSIKEIMQ